MPASSCHPPFLLPAGPLVNLEAETPASSHCVAPTGCLEGPSRPLPSEESVPGESYTTIQCALVLPSWASREWGQAWETSGFRQGTVIIQIGILCALLSLSPFLPQSSTSASSVSWSPMTHFCFPQPSLWPVRLPLVLFRIGWTFGHLFWGRIRTLKS